MQNRRLYVMNHLDHHWLRRHWLQQGVVKKAGCFSWYSARRKSTTHCGSTNGLLHLWAAWYFWNFLKIIRVFFAMKRQHPIPFDLFLVCILRWKTWKKSEILHLHQGKSHYHYSSLQLTRTVASVPFVPFGARHVHGVLERQLGNVYGSNSRSKQVLVHRRARAESRNFGSP
jgi:hypothetical protein